jgi:hypothetical protein
MSSEAQNLHDLAGPFELETVENHVRTRNFWATEIADSIFVSISASDSHRTKITSEVPCCFC